jgi:hypothetical protein
MPTLDRDALTFRFPATDPDATASIHLQRTLRIPDSDRTYPLPPGLGRFPLRHAEDYPALPADTRSRGGAVLPIWQAEALWIYFGTDTGRPGPDFPVAIKIAAGKINAVTGGPWAPGLSADPQDYVVAPDQPWLDGFAIAPGVIRQFVAMPLGQGYTAEEQITGAADWGGLQVSVTPLKPEVWAREVKAWEERPPLPRHRHGFGDGVMMSSAAPMMGLAPGGRMRQTIAPDRFAPDDWDLSQTDRVFLTLVPAHDWKRLTGEPAPTHPPSAQDYARAHLPWFDTYACDHPLPGSDALAGLASVGEKHLKDTGAPLPGAQDVTTVGPRQTGPRPVNRPLNRPVRTGAGAGL